MRPPIYLVELPTLTPREVVLKSYAYGPPCAVSEPTIQFATLCVEISRAEKRYTAEQRLRSDFVWDDRAAGGDFHVDFPPGMRAVELYTRAMKGRLK